MIHADDLGLCHGANAAFQELAALGAATCGSVMVPAPWFLEIAEMQARDPTLDIGVHLTLNAEKRHYRWRPLTGASPAAGLTDEDGYFRRSVPELRRRAHPEAVEAELRAQIETALAAGIDVTHLDDHMGAVLCPEFLGIYVRLGREYCLPIVLVDSLDCFDPRHNLDETGDGGALAAAAEAARAYGSPIFEAVLETPWQRGESVAADYAALLRRAPAGLSFLALHFNQPGEIAWIEPETAQIRVDEYEFFRQPGTLEALRRQFCLCGMRELKENLNQG